MNSSISIVYRKHKINDTDWSKFPIEDFKKEISKCFENSDIAYENIMEQMNKNTISLPFMIFQDGINEWQYALEDSKDMPLLEL